LSRIHAFETMSGNRDSRLWQSFFQSGLRDTGDPFYAHRIRWRNTAWALRLLAPAVRERADDAANETEIGAALPNGWWLWSPLARAQAAEMASFLTPYLLASQGDRVAMASGVEARYPFLDPGVMAWSNGLPDRMKLRGLRDKRVLRRLAARLLPPDIAERPKRPYRAPTTSALFGGRLPDWAEDALTPEALRRHGLVDAAATTALAARARLAHGRMAGEREEMALVGVLTLQHLAHQMIDELPRRLAEARGRLDRLPCMVHEDRSDQAAVTRRTELLR
jgi:asparagine synthase (glutamine-hydrolysing)